MRYSDLDRYYPSAHTFYLNPRANAGHVFPFAINHLASYGILSPSFASHASVLRH